MSILKWRTREHPGYSKPGYLGKKRVPYPSDNPNHELGKNVSDRLRWGNKNKIRAILF